MTSDTEIARAILCRALRLAAMRGPSGGDRPNFNRMALDVQEARAVDIPSWLALDALVFALGGDPE